MAESDAQKHLVKGKWLFLIAAWTIYGILVLVAMLTGQPESILKTLFSGEVFGGLGLVTMLVIFFA